MQTHMCNIKKKKIIVMKTQQSHPNEKPTETDADAPGEKAKREPHKP